MSMSTKHLLIAAAVLAAGYFIGRGHARGTDNTNVKVQAADVPNGGMWTWNGQ